MDVDETDEKVLDAANRLGVILRQANGNQGSNTNANFLDAITPADARKLAASVSTRLWTNRGELAVLTGHLAYVILRQTAKRLDKPKSGRKKNKVEVTEDMVVFDNIVASTAVVPPVILSSGNLKGIESSRLKTARNMLLNKDLTDA